MHVSLSVKHAKLYFDIFFLSVGSLIVGCLTLCFISRRRWLCVKDIAKQWNLLVPAIAALGLLALVHVEKRHTAPFVVLLWMGVFSGIHLPNSQESKRLANCVTNAIVTVMMIIIVFSPSIEVVSAARNLIRGRNPWPHLQWQVADGLNPMGVQPTDKVAFIGRSFDAGWARLARVRIVAEIPQRDMDNFWAADPLVKSQVIKTFTDTGAKVIATRNLTRSVSTIDWRKIGNTGYYAYTLPR